MCWKKKEPYVTGELLCTVYMKEKRDFPEQLLQTGFNFLNLQGVGPTKLFGSDVLNFERQLWMFILLNVDKQYMLHWKVSILYMWGCLHK